MSDRWDAAKQQEQAENGSLRKDAGKSEQNMYTSVQPYLPKIERSRRGDGISNFAYVEGRPRLAPMNQGCFTEKQLRAEAGAAAATGSS